MPTPVVTIDLQLPPGACIPREDEHGDVQIAVGPGTEFTVPIAQTINDLFEQRTWSQSVDGNQQRLDVVDRELAMLSYVRQRTNSSVPRSVPNALLWGYFAKPEPDSRAQQS